MKSYILKGNRPRLKDAQCNISLPKIIEESVDVKAVNKCTNAVLQILSENKLNVRDSIYTLRLCEEILLYISPTKSKEVEVFASGEDVRWLIEEDC